MKVYSDKQIKLSNGFMIHNLRYYRESKIKYLYTYDI